MLKLEVGKFYMSANGGIVEIDSISKSNSQWLWDKNENSYHISGKYIKNKESNYELIAEIPKELHQYLIKQVMDYWQDEDFRNTVNNVYGGEK